MYYKFIFAFLLFSSVSSLYAQTLGLQVTVDKTDVLTGETLKYSFAYTCSSVNTNCTQVSLVANIPAGIIFPTQTLALTPDIDSYTISVDRKTITFIFKEPLQAGSTGVIDVTGKAEFGLANNTPATLTAELKTGATVGSTGIINTTIHSDNKFCPSKSQGTGLVPDQTTQYTLALGYVGGYGTNGIGATHINDVSFVDQLPLGAIIDSVKFDETSMVSYTPLPLNVCVVDNLNSKLTCTLPPTYFNVVSGYAPLLRANVFVRYPANVFSANQLVTNSVAFTYTPQGGVPTTVVHGTINNFTSGATYTTLANQSCTAVLDVTDIIANPNPVLMLNKGVLNNTTAMKPGETSYYYLNIRNQGNVVLSNSVIEDVVPSDVTVTQIVPSEFINMNANTVVYEVKTVSNPIYTPIVFTGNAWIPPIGEIVTHVKMTIPNMPVGARPSYNYTGANIYFKLNANVVSPNFQNCITGTTGTGGALIDNTNACHTITVLPPDTYSSLSVSKLLLQGPFNIYAPYYVSLQTGNVVWSKIVGTNNAGGLPLSNPVIMDLLPAGLAYDNSILYEAPTATADTVDILPNYNGTGRTLIRLKWNTSLPSGASLSVSIRTKVTSLLPGGDPNLVALPQRRNPYIPTQGLKNSSFFTGSSASQCRIPQYYTLDWVAVKDTFDLNGDGSTVDTLCYDTQYASVVSSASLESIKWVKGQCDTVYSRYPNYGQTVPGGQADYRLVLKNSGNVPMKDIKIVDILPFIGDRGVIDPNPRSSQWRPNLADTIAAPSGVTVYYSVESKPCRDEIKPANMPSPFPAGCNVANWTTSAPADITKVQSVKIDFGARIVGVGDSLVFSWPMRAPVIAPTNNEIAWNSFGFVATRTDNNQPLLPAEPNKVGIKVKAGQPGFYGNRVWFDTNHDGIQDAGEGGVDGVKVKLLRQLGGTQNVATDPLIGFTITADGGYYRFSNLPVGDYYAIFCLPAGYSISPQNAVGSTNGNDSDGTATTYQGKPATITVTTNIGATEEDYTWDQGIYCGITPSVTVNQTVRPGQSATLTALGGTTYLWTGPNGFSATTAAITINPVTATEAGTYSVNIQSNTCYANLTTGIVLDTTPALINLVLTKTVDSTCVYAAGQTVHFTLKVKNTSTVNATGVNVKVDAGSGFTFVSAAPSVSFASATGIWTIGSINAGDSATLVLTVKADSAGVNYCTAEINVADQMDTNSTPNNGVTTEDDIARVCVSVPIKICTGETFTASLPSGLTGIKWFKNNVEIIGQTAASLTIATSGDYTFSANESTCPVEGCCPIKVVVGSCTIICKPVICLPVVVMRQ